MKKLILSIFCLLSSLIAFSQQKIDLGDFNPILYSGDQQGNIYGADQRGNIVKWDIRGKKIGEYRPSRPISYSILSTTLGLKILAFSEELQEGIWLDRQLNLIGNFQIPSEAGDFISHIQVGIDNSLWMVNEQSQVLMKWDIVLQKLVFEVALTNFFSQGQKNEALIKSLSVWGQVLVLNISDQNYFFLTHLGQISNQLDFPEKVQLILGEELWYLAHVKSTSKLFRWLRHDKDELIMEINVKPLLITPNFFLTRGRNHLIINRFP